MTGKSEIAAGLGGADDLGKATAIPVRQQRMLGWSAFLCNNAGVVLRCFGDELGASAPLATRRSISSLVSLQGQQRIADFLGAIHHRRTAFGWEMELAGRKEPHLFHGCQVATGILVLVTPRISTAAAETSAPGPVVREQKRINEEAPARIDRPIALPAKPQRMEKRPDPLPLTAHDLRNVIISIISAAEFITDYTAENLTDQQLELVQRMKSAAGALMAFADQVFDPNSKPGG